MPSALRHPQLQSAHGELSMAAAVEKVVIFTDGACSGNPGPGGWAAVLVSPLGKVLELGGAAAHTTNNKMELMATVEALSALTRMKKLTTREISLYTDSKYVIQGITQWIYGWKKNGWKNSTGQDVSNREIWEPLHELAEQFEIDWLYVPGHSGYPGNERCDEIAVAFAKGYAIDLFAGKKEDYPRDLSRLPSPRALDEPKPKKGPAVYLSFLEGKLERHRDWKSCEARVKGRTGARFKKVESAEEEAATLRAWGVRTS